MAQAWFLYDAGLGYEITTIIWGLELIFLSLRVLASLCRALRFPGANFDLTGKGTPHAQHCQSRHYGSIAQASLPHGLEID